MVLGYHGCAAELAAERVGGTRPIMAWPHSKNPYDWPGNSSYFWEHGPHRAVQWARARYGDAAATVGAIIHLGRCFDLLDVEFTRELLPAYQAEHGEKEAAGLPLPVNRLPTRIVAAGISTVSSSIDVFWDSPSSTRFAARFSTVRQHSRVPRSFASHIQIAVRDRGASSAYSTKLTLVSYPSEKQELVEGLRRALSAMDARTPARRLQYQVTLGVKDRKADYALDFGGAATHPSPIASRGCELRAPRRFR